MSGFGVNQELTQSCDQSTLEASNGSMTIQWHLYRTKAGEWVLFSGPISLTTPDRSRVEKRLIESGVRPVEIEELFQREAENGEGVITVPIGLERLYEDGLRDPD